MKAFLLMSALLGQMVLLQTASAQTSSITRDLAPDGRWSFTFSGTCNNVVNVQTPLAVKESVNGSDKAKIHLAIQAPAPVDTERRGKPICSYLCPTGSQAIALSIVGSKDRLLTCIAVE
jgi:hypothetical protein